MLTLSWWDEKRETHLIFGWKVYLECYLFCFVRFWRYKLPHNYPNSAEYPNGNQGSKLKSRET